MKFRGWVDVQGWIRDRILENVALEQSPRVDGLYEQRIFMEKQSSDQEGRICDEEK